jgi:hypothetical protein
MEDENELLETNEFTKNLEVAQAEILTTEKPRN